MSSQYRIKVMRNEWRGFERARLQISVGQDYHEGEKLKALVGWVGRHFKRSAVNVCDSLQRHNLRYKGVAPHPAAESLAIDLGNEWLQRNGSILSELPEPEITRWNDWRNRPEYPAALATTMDLYAVDPEFKTIIDTQAELRWSKSNEPNDKKGKFIQASKLYMLEEVAVTLVMSDEQTAEVYPGTFLPAFNFLRENGYNGPQSMTSLGFARRKQAVELV